MPTLFDTIRQLVVEGRYLVGQHAAERLDERNILEWQMVEGIEHAELIVENPDDQPNPSIEVQETLPDGTPVKVIWSHIASINIAKLVTVHFFDR